jgi:hypothetical protein
MTFEETELAAAAFRGNGDKRTFSERSRGQNVFISDIIFLKKLIEQNVFQKSFGFGSRVSRYCRLSRLCLCFFWNQNPVMTVTRLE